MNFLRLRPMSHIMHARTYATAPFVPPRSLDTIDPKSFTATLLPRPKSPTFYTARSDFYDGIRLLEKALNASQCALREVHLFPYPDAAKNNLPPARFAWKKAEDLSRELGATLTTARHRRVLALLAQLDDLRRIALAGAEDDIATRISGLLEPFERPDKNLSRGRRKPVVFDEYGRTYALGKRKESAARVWMIPVRSEVPEVVQSGLSELQSQPQSQLAQPLAQSEAQLLAQPQAQPQAQPLVESDPEPKPLTKVIQVEAVPEVHATPSTILVNNLSLARYFPNEIDRQRIVRPLKLAGVLGAFNVFALVRGGGSTGQAGAIAHGIAKNLVAHVPDIELILRRGRSSLHFAHILLILPQPRCSNAIPVWWNGRKLAVQRPGSGYVALTLRQLNPLFIVPPIVCLGQTLTSGLYGAILSAVYTTNAYIHFTLHSLLCEREANVAMHGCGTSKTAKMWPRKDKIDHQWVQADAHFKRELSQDESFMEGIK